ncbi:hypothetical protein HWB92_gp088 [Serratia phage vB_SmaA_3M]|uniref:Uncharacterized protein n=1 Tax=Serratia phage vB_SmaA_3M TaxID=2419930 RepID=A0A3G2YS56_9CAUD|nr:hypothetical protein HWB92_gp088 [Serratia phage vB_SmaA_3M]AYP28346.1 hypothetical protein 3M_090 [Serratia phage vB_SmaA_3M]
MAEQNIFEVASRKKLRFGTVKGPISTEDLWDLKLETGVVNLNQVAQIIHREQQAAGEVNFVSTKPTANAELDLKMEIVKHVIAYKIQLQDQQTRAAATRQRNELITDIIARKQQSELEGKSIEELQAMLDK